MKWYTYRQIDLITLFRPSGNPDPSHKPHNIDTSATCPRRTQLLGRQQQHYIVPENESGLPTKAPGSQCHATLLTPHT